MEILVAIAVAVALYWAFSAKRASQASLRYQLHKDALAEAARFLQKYKHRERAEGRHYFEVRNAELEVRSVLQSDLEDLAVHVTTTHVPVQLGDAALLRDLLATLERTRIWSDGPLPPEMRRDLRERVMDGLFANLRESVRGFDPDPILVRLQLDAIAYAVDLGRDVLAWNVSATQVSWDEAKNLLRDGEGLLERHGYQREGEPAT